VTSKEQRAWGEEGCWLPRCAGFPLRSNWLPGAGIKEIFGKFYRGVQMQQIRLSVHLW